MGLSEILDTRPVLVSRVQGQNRRAMRNTPLLTVDFTQEQSVSKLFPRLPLLTSEKLGWNQIHLQCHHQPAWETPETTHIQHALAVMYDASEPIQAERMLGDERQEERLVTGSCAIIPAYARHQGYWAQDAKFMVLGFSPSDLNQMAYETVDSDRVELMPQFAKLDPVLSSVALAFKAELESGGAGGQLYAESATTFLMAHLLRHYCTDAQALPNYPGGLAKDKLREAIAYIQAHLGEAISLNEIAAHLNMSQYYFCHQFKQSMGISPYQYVLQQRIEKAKRLLKTQELNVTDVALECGFANQSHFTRHFRKLTGTTPRGYRVQL